MNSSQQALAPFSCTYTAQVPELLQKLQCSLAISTYQAGKLIFISAKNENALVQLPRHFEKAMGIALAENGERMALAGKYDVTVFQNSPDLAEHYPKAPATYDALYMPRATYHTGPLDIHDLSFGAQGKLYAVNTLFSCIMEVSNHYNFTDYWRPPFIDTLVSEDRCHLNGMALEKGKPRYVTAFNSGNTAQSWRDNPAQNGVIMDVESNEIICSGLAMPHTPRLFKEELYVLLSAKGELAKIDTQSGKIETVARLDGFVRGMALQGDYLFVGISKLRQNSSAFGKLPFAAKAKQAGIAIIHLPTGSLAGQIHYHISLDEIYDVAVLPQKMRPNILNTRNAAYLQGLTTPDATYWAAENDNS